jgi:hypothetical protein
MDRSPSEPRELSLEQLVDSHDLRAVIGAALAASPVDERALRRGVWTYVVAERVVGTPPGYVIVSLTQMVDASGVTPNLLRQTLTRRVILWCVEAYFGHLGGERAGAGEESAEGRDVPPMMVSNR